MGFPLHALASNLAGFIGRPQCGHGISMRYRVTEQAYLSRADVAGVCAVTIKVLALNDLRSFGRPESLVVVPALDGPARQRRAACAGIFN